MVIQALRFALSDSDETMDDALKLNLLKMLSVMLQETDIENKRLAMTQFYSAGICKQALIFHILPTLLRYVTKASEINPALIREVQMGPFKHKVDDGLELRKVCGECNITYFANMSQGGIRDTARASRYSLWANEPC